MNSRERTVVLTPGVEVLGRDAADRLVVQKRKPITHKLEQWAVKKDGDPTDITPPIQTRVPAGSHDPDACEICGLYGGNHDGEDCYK